MIRYFLVATTLKVFSLTGFTKRIYRRAGNVVGQARRKKAGIRKYKIRGELLLRLLGKYSVSLDGSTLLELGTGWMHWFALYVRVHHRAKITMFDVWDNRQLGALQSAFSRLEGELGDKQRGEPVLESLHAISSARSFSELYQALNMRYVIDERGSLTQFEANSFDAVFSFHVLEHVRKEDVEQLIADMHRVLKPGGLSIHQIGIDDHLSHYDKRESEKKYLSYSETTWEKWFKNDIQYMNRYQARDWCEFFSRAGFELLERGMEKTDISTLSIAVQYESYSPEDLACTGLTIAHRKPLSNPPS